MLSLRRARLEALALLSAPGAMTHAPPSASVALSKRVTDILVATILLIASSPIWLVAAVIIRLTSPGPVLFRQERVGIDGKRFTCYKFRTMHHGATDQTHREFVVGMLKRSERSAGARSEYKLVDDPRVIGACRWLRKTSLDELPQRINVLRGEMSMVGPRPPLPYEVEHYREWQMERLTVRPGITGLWQISGRNRLTYDEMCALDIHYLRSWSYMTDLMIMAVTPWVMFVDGGGAE